MKDTASSDVQKLTRDVGKREPWVVNDGGNHHLSGHGRWGGRWGNPIPSSWRGKVRWKFQVPRLEKGEVFDFR